MWASTRSPPTHQPMNDFCLLHLDGTRSAPRLNLELITFPLAGGHGLHKSLCLCEFHEPALCVALKVKLIIPLLAVNPCLTSNESLPLSVVCVSRKKCCLPPRNGEMQSSRRCRIRTTGNERPPIHRWEQKATAPVAANKASILISSLIKRRFYSTCLAHKKLFLGTVLTCMYI